MNMYRLANRNNSNGAIFAPLAIQGLLFISFL